MALGKGQDKMDFLAHRYYYYVLVVFCVSVAVMWVIVHSPFGKALQATPGNLKVIEREKRRYGALLLKEKEENEALARRIQAVSLTLVRKVGENDVLYGSVTSADIGESLQKEGIVVDKRRIQLADPIKSLGIYTVPVRLHPEVVADVKVWVVKE